MKTTKRLQISDFRFQMAAAVCAFALFACETGADGPRQLTPQASATLKRLGSDALTIGEGAIAGAAAGAEGNALGQVTSGGKVDSQQLEAAAAAGAVDGAAAAFRSLAGRRTAPTAGEIQSALADSTGSPAVTAKLTPVATKVAQAIAQGAPPDAALETAAASLNRSAALARDAAP